MEAKLWPRGCAVAERLWSDPETSAGSFDPKVRPDKASYAANWSVEKNPIKIINFIDILFETLPIRLQHIRGLIYNTPFSL